MYEDISKKNPYSFKFFLYGLNPSSDQTFQLGKDLVPKRSRPCCGSVRLRLDMIGSLSGLGKAIDRGHYPSFMFYH